MCFPKGYIDIQNVKDLCQPCSGCKINCDIWLPHTNKIVSKKEACNNNMLKTCNSYVLTDS